MMLPHYSMNMSEHIIIGSAHGPLSLVDGRQDCAERPGGWHRPEATEITSPPGNQEPPVGREHEGIGRASLLNAERHLGHERLVADLGAP